MTSGTDVLPSFVPSGDDPHRLFRHPRCTGTILAFQNYRVTDLGDGLFDPRPAPDAGNHA